MVAPARTLAQTVTPMSQPAQFHLLLQRRYGPFFLTQLGGAFNDSLLKQMLVVLVTYHAADYTTLPAGVVTSLAAGIFILPFVLFSAVAGQLADRYDKALLMRTVKAAEVAIMAVAAAGFYLHSLALLLAALFLMGTHSTFFGPAKYSLLPRVLEDAELVGGNGLLEMGTFVSILVGTLVAGLIVAATTDPLWLTAVLLGVALFGLAASLYIPPNGCADPGLRMGWSLIGPTVDILRRAHRVPAVWLSLLGISWFWFFGAAFLSQLPVLVHDQLHAGETSVTLVLGVFSIGVGLGSLLCERMSGGRVEWGLVPFGSMGMSLFAADLYFGTGHFPAAPAQREVAQLLAEPAAWRLLADVGLLGLFGGFFSVPLYATVQSRSERSEQSRVIAANNVLNALFMVLAALMGMALTTLGATPHQIIGLCAVLNALVAVYIYGLLPEFLWRFCAWILVNTVYRLRVQGAQYLPARGAAVLAPNHVSYVDALVLSAVSPRPVRFVMDHAIFDSPVLGWLFRAVGAIPIAPAREDPQLLAQAYDRIAQSLQEGELVCIFPEGRLTRDGQLGELRRGIVEIVERTPVPVIPVAIHGLQDSLFARASRHPGVGRNPFARRIGVTAAPALAPGEWDLDSLRARLEALLQPAPAAARA
jgi:1-acyl-sn-glycerol-3-phosphate acyltransferase